MISTFRDWKFLFCLFSCMWKLIFINISINQEERIFNILPCHFSSSYSLSCWMIAYKDENVNVLKLKTKAECNDKNR